MDWFEVFEEYERLYSIANLARPDRVPSNTEQREAIVEDLRVGLGICDEWLPTIDADVVREEVGDGYVRECITFQSWRKVYGGAHLYLPAGVNRSASPRPVVLLCTGHGKSGRLNVGYQAAARRIAQQGAYVLVPDLIGQGERHGMGHRDAIIPLACGTSLQGLIAMEALAWIDWLERDARFDGARLAAIGNSGGGTLTCVLGAVSDKLAVLSSSGYPSTFDYIARCKERLHCACNILPGMVGRVEMWQLYGAFAPKPLFLFQGANDHFFPHDLFFQVARKVKHVYDQYDGANLEFAAFSGGHSWDSGRRRALADFLSRHLGLDPAAQLSDDTTGLSSDHLPCWKRFPDDAMSTNELAMELSGQRHPDSLRLWDIFPPRKLGAPSDAASLVRGQLREVAAQLESFLDGSVGVEPSLRE